MRKHEDYGSCPHCGEVRNMAGMTRHIKKAHRPKVVA